MRANGWILVRGSGAVKDYSLYWLFSEQYHFSRSYDNTYDISQSDYSDW